MSFDNMDIDVLEVIQGASNKPFSFLAHYPGCGVGGHCIPVDPYYLIKNAEINGFDHKFLKVARKINNGMPAYTVSLLGHGLKKSGLDGKDNKDIKVALLGLSYKANIGDIRESPAVTIYKLLDEKYNTRFFDPYIDHYKDFNNSKNLEDLLSWADAVILATIHDEFKKLPSQVGKFKNIKVLIDGRNFFQKSDFGNNLFYKGIGR
jgi:nucleotide sugar dehydrogenase